VAAASPTARTPRRIRLEQTPIMGSSSVLPAQSSTPGAAVQGAFTTVVARDNRPAGPV